MQVRPGAPARAARGAQALARGDLLPGAHAPAGQVGVERDPAVAERDLHQVSVALVPWGRTDGDDSSRLGCANDGGAKDPDVDPGMPAAAVVAERAGHRSLRRPRGPGGRGLW